MTTLLLALACGAVIGLVLGGFGGGGSVLAVPALVYVLGESAHDATTASLVVVGISAAVSVVGHYRAGSVDVPIGLTFVVVGAAFAYLGSKANTQVSAPVLLGSFAALLLMSSVVMGQRGLALWAVDRRSERALFGVGSPGGAGLEGAGVEGAGLNESAMPSGPTGGRRSVLIGVSAAIVGFLTGLLGVGGGFVVMPVLVMGLGMTMVQAAGTALVVVSLNAAVALASRLRTGLEVDLSVVVPFTAATTTSSFVGQRLTRRLPSSILTVIFAGILALVAIGVGLDLAL